MVEFVAERAHGALAPARSHDATPSTSCRASTGYRQEYGESSESAATKLVCEPYGPLGHSVARLGLTSGTPVFGPAARGIGPRGPGLGRFFVRCGATRCVIASATNQQRTNVLLANLGSLVRRTVATCIRAATVLRRGPQPVGSLRVPGRASMHWCPRRPPGHRPMRYDAPAGVEPALGAPWRHSRSCHANAGR